MRKKGFLVLALSAIMLLMAGCSGVGTVPPQKKEGDVIVMRLAHINAMTDPKQKEAEKFKELVEAKTNGKVKINIFGAGQLGDVNEIIEGLQIGTNEIVIEGFGTITSYTKLSLLDLVPFMWRDRDHFDKVWESRVGEELLNQAGDEAGMKLYGPSYRGVRVTTSVKQFSNLQELKGLKIRVPGDEMSVATWRALGTTPTPMAMNEVLTGIQQGTIEAQENPPLLSYNFGLADACKYLIKTNHRWSADVFLMNKGYFDSLSPDIQKAILESGREAAKYVSQINTEDEQKAFDKWKQDGAKIIEPDLAPFKAATKDVVHKQFPVLEDWVTKIENVK